MIRHTLIIDTNDPIFNDKDRADIRSYTILVFISSILTTISSIYIVYDRIITIFINADDIALFTSDSLLEMAMLLSVSGIILNTLLFFAIPTKKSKILAAQEKERQIAQKTAYEEKRRQKEEFIKSKKINKVFKGIKEEIYFSNVNREAYIFDGLNFKHKINYNSITECSLVEDNSTIMSGGVGRAFVGGIVAGGVGAIVGANTRKSRDVVNSLYVRILVGDNAFPIQNIVFIDTQTQRNSKEYREKYSKAEALFATIKSIVSSSPKLTKNCLSVDNSNIQKNSTENNIKALIDLKETGKITEDEFIDILKRITE